MTCNRFGPRVYGHVPCRLGGAAEDRHPEPEWPDRPAPYDGLHWTWDRHHGHYTALGDSPRGIIHYAYRYNHVADHYEVIRAGEVLATVKKEPTDD